jgi:signal transduction histidine kinase
LAPFATIQLLRLDSFVPAVEAIIFITDLATAVLLFNQFSLVGSRALLLLASGYLFSALVVVPHVLTFPGVFAPRGLLGAGLQSTPWLYIFWHMGFAAAVIGYACLTNEKAERGAIKTSPLPAIMLSAMIVIGLVCALTWLTTTGESFMPRLFLDQIELAPLAQGVAGINLLMGVAALVLLWARRRSVLDLWLAVAVCALIAELATVSFVLVSRYSVGFYLGRIFSVAVSTTVLIMLLSDTAGLYGRFARANRALQRKREMQLMKFEAAIIELAHKIRQPLTGISINAAAARHFLERQPQDFDQISGIFGEIQSAGYRASEILEGVLGRLRSSNREQQLVDVNETILDAIAGLRWQLKDHAVVTRLDLGSDLSAITGSGGQLQIVIRSLVKNSIEAMSTNIAGGSRSVKVATARYGREEIVISVEDTGPGIDPQMIDAIFDAFVTTKNKRLGLGLAICRMIVERHGGRISVSCSSGGTRFQVTLPIGAAASQ